MSTEPVNPEEALKNQQMKQAIKDGLKYFLSGNRHSLMGLIFKGFEEQKVDYSNFGQEALLDILSSGNQICCQSTIIQSGNRRVVLQSFLRLEEEPVNQQASTPANQ